MRFLDPQDWQDISKSEAETEKDLETEIAKYNVRKDQEAGVTDGSSPCERRYRHRIVKFIQDGRPLPKVRHLGYWLLHNCVAHPLLGLFPGWKTTQVHELTSLWLNHVQSPEEHGKYFKNVPTMLRLNNPTPNVKIRWAWVLHNCMVHPVIGIVPSRLTFRLHDWTADLMGVPDWV